MANTPHEPTEETRKEVKLLSGFGISEKHIAAYIGIAEKTLRKHYREELDKGIATQIVTAGKELFKKVQAGNLTAIIFFLKTRGGFSEKLDLSNTDGTLAAPSTVRRVIVKTKEEARRLEAQLQEAQERRENEEKAIH